MTSFNFQENQIMPNLGYEPLPSPKGWVTTGIHIINLNATDNNEDMEILLDRNLAMAANRTEQLIEALDASLSIEVPVSYMRVEKDAMFHVLLLINGFDFQSPKILAARALAEKFAKTEGYDIRFVFAIESENRMNNTIKFSGYKLMHRKNSEPGSEQLH